MQLKWKPMYDGGAALNLRYMTLTIRKWDPSTPKGPWFLHCPRLSLSEIETNLETRNLEEGKRMAVAIVQGKLADMLDQLAHFGQPCARQPVAGG